MTAALPKSLRADWTDAPELKKECHRGRPNAESSIRIANVRMVDMISVTPVRMWVVVTCRESWTASRRKRIVSAWRDVPGKRRVGQLRNRTRTGDGGARSRSAKRHH